MLAPTWNNSRQGHFRTGSRREPLKLRHHWSHFPRQISCKVAWDAGSEDKNGHQRVQKCKIKPQLQNIYEIADFFQTLFLEWEYSELETKLLHKDLPKTGTVWPLSFEISGFHTSLACGFLLMFYRLPLFFFFKEVFVVLIGLTYKRAEFIAINSERAEIEVTKFPELKLKKSWWLINKNILSSY